VSGGGIPGSAVPTGQPETVVKSLRGVSLSQFALTDKAVNKR